MYQFFKIAVCVLCLALSTSAISKEIGVVAQVNESAITAADIEDRSTMMIRLSGMPDNIGSRDAIKDRVLETLIDEKLIQQESQRLKIELDDYDLDNAYRNIAGRNNKSVEDFKKMLVSKGVSLQSFEQQIKNQIIWSKIVATHIQPTILVSAKEIKDNKLSIEKQIKIANEVAELDLAEIVFYINNQADFAKKMELAKRLIINIKEGSEFSSIARQFSQGFTAKSGGVIGKVLSNQMNPMVAKQLMQIKASNISDPIVLEDGIHIFKIINKKVINEKDAALSDDEIKEVLMNKKVESGVKTYIKKLRLKAHIK
ncbi:MAG: SurA N-terminal domain-containing protein [Alphaproteobacteria bacterium]|jgi:peptidyl-prolyl cis-trans isomerase SurA|nr:SurA N-terminal domain-containing protein [Candidatus Jidaibacter sp.]